MTFVFNSKPEYTLLIKIIDNSIELPYKEINNFTGNAGYDIFVNGDTIVKSNINNIHQSEDIFTQFKSNIQSEMLKEYSKMTISNNIITNIESITENSSYLLLSRSSLSKYGFFMPHSVGLIDASHRGEILGRVCSINSEDKKINNSERLFQLVAPDLSEFKVKIVEELSTTARGSGGFGSTNKIKESDINLEILHKLNVTENI